MYQFFFLSSENQPIPEKKMSYVVKLRYATFIVLFSVVKLFYIFNQKAKMLSGSDA